MSLLCCLLKLLLSVVKYCGIVNLLIVVITVDVVYLFVSRCTLTN